MKIEDVIKEKWVLASNSPRRKDLLSKHGVSYEIIMEEIEEKKDCFLSPVSMCMSLAFQKGVAVAEKHPFRKVISADTIVVCNGELFGKPKNDSDAFEMLKKLSGNTQHILTGFSLLCWNYGIKFVDYDISEIKFKKLSNQTIKKYIDTGDYKDKAGAYGIQSGAYDFVDYIVGDSENVIGLPTKKVLNAMGQVEHLLSDLD